MAQWSTGIWKMWVTSSLNFEQTKISGIRPKFCFRKNQSMQLFTEKIYIDPQGYELQIETGDSHYELEFVHKKPTFKGMIE